MFNFGFSYTGLIFLLMLFIPNIICAKNMPKGYSSQGENKMLGIFERVGEVLCTCCALIFADFNIRFSWWTLWLIASFILMCVYEIYWIRYFKSDKTLNDFYKSVFFVPLPGATLPVIAFLLLGIYGRNVFMIFSSVILGIGHIGIHAGYYREIKN